MLSFGTQGGTKQEKKYNKSKLIARLGVHNVKKMPVVDVAIMTIFNQQKNRVIMMANQKETFARIGKAENDKIAEKNKLDEIAKIKGLN